MVLSGNMMDESHPDYHLHCLHGQLLTESYPTIAKASAGADKNIRSKAYWNKIISVLKEDLEALTKAGVQESTVIRLERRIVLVQQAIDSIE